ncbi:winged helix-turn-helix domain-containing protein [Pseudomonas sp.]|uniref:winged helix-turn-helix domain-containing protein n=1 Tax=Pseudomonas sp. TaxID=306 RepID=UPI003D0E6A81
MNTLSENQAADAGATLSCLIIRTGRADCYAHFYPALYQLQLIRDGAEEKVDLGFSGSRLLERLLQNPGEVVAREELMSHAWSDRVVGQGSLNQQIYTLRQVLADEKNREIIQTLPRRGYLFNPNFLSTPPAAEPLPEASEPSTEDTPPAPLITVDPPQTTRNQRSLLLALPISLVLLGGALLLYLFDLAQPSELLSNQLKIGQATVIYVDRDELHLQQLTHAAQPLAKRMAALATSPTDLVFGMASDYYEVLCVAGQDSVRSLMVHESQLERIADAQLQACLP